MLCRSVELNPTGEKVDSGIPLHSLNADTHLLLIVFFFFRTKSFCQIFSYSTLLNRNTGLWDSKDLSVAQVSLPDTLCSAVFFWRQVSLLCKDIN